MSDDDKRRRIEAMYEKARSAFAGVPEVTVQELRDLQAREKVVLVDVRTPEERAVSMIPGAITAEQLEASPEAYEDATLVPYCTIGGRSGRYTARLHAAGRRACNLRGAILAWTHAGGELEGPDGPTRKVHVHGRKFNLVADGYEGVW